MYYAMNHGSEAQIKSLNYHEKRFSMLLYKNGCVIHKFIRSILLKIQYLVYVNILYKKRNYP